MIVRCHARDSVVRVDVYQGLFGSPVVAENSVEESRIVQVLYKHELSCLWVLGPRAETSKRASTERPLANTR